MPGNSSIQDEYNFSEIMNAFHQYRESRNNLLDTLNLRSNRDPLSEFSEWLVAAVVDGTLAESRVQKDWDVRGSNDERIQVKYLANTTDSEWVNEHEIHLKGVMTSYAIVIFEALEPKAVIIFPANNLEAVGKELGKQHGNLQTTLWFTRVNYQQIRDNVSRFKTLGMRLHLPPDWAIQ